jgi:hypothetical protein
METATLVKEIAGLQVKNSGSGYPAGLFPSQRKHVFLPLQREDSNVFFSASVVYILEGICSFLPETDREIIREIGRKVRQTYPLYRNKYGLKTYNFWQTNPSRHFPNGLWMHRTNFFQLPDEIDTTGLIYLTNNPTKEEVLWLREKMTQHANGIKLHIKTTLPKYQDLQAYSTWFGKKMPIEFDVCVLSNALLLFFKHRIPLNFHDEETLRVIRGVIKDKDYFTNPYRISPSYPNPANILFHLARLLAEPHAAPLADLKAPLISDLKKHLETVTDPMEKLILDTSLMRLRERSQVNVPEELFKTAATRNFYWFTAGFLSVYGNPLLKALAKYSVSHLKYNCPAFNLALLLEHEVYRKLRAL